MTLPLRIAFFGSDPLALPLLRALRRQGSLVQLVGVFTQPDRPTGRGQKIQANAIKEWALTEGLPVYQPEILTEEVRAQLAGLTADLGLVMAYGHILKNEFMATPRLGMLNLHTSILPRYRGASPIQTAVANGDVETGVTLMRIVKKLDAGPIADVARVPVAPLDTALEAEVKLGEACIPLVLRALPQLAAGTLNFTPQDDAAATYCRKLEKADGVLDFTASAKLLAARINGLFPWPACFFELDRQPIKLGLADQMESAAIARAGEVLGADGDGLLVGTGEGTLRLRRLQRPGGKMLPAGDFLRGFPIPPGTLIPSGPMRPLLVTK